MMGLSRFFVRCWIGCCALLAVGFPAVTYAQSTEVQLYFLDGHILTAEPQAETLRWEEVRRDGSTAQRWVPLGDIRQLVLVSSPASQRVAEIRRLLNDLGAVDYARRENAETRLSDPEFASSFLSMIKPLLEDQRLEVRHRAQRIYDRLSEETPQLEVLYDRLVLADGTELEGNAGEFQWQVNYRGQTVPVTRQDLYLVQAPSPNTVPVQPPEPLNVQLFHEPGDDFYQPHQRRVDFSADPRGAELRRDQEVNDLFVPWGLRLGTEVEGHVAVSSFSFDKYSDQATGNSVAVYDFTTTNRKRFKGVMTVDFCLPERPTVRAGVQEFGVYLARVDSGRDFLLEGYDAAGDLVVCVESRAPAGFLGFRSQRPIAHLRILSNPHLYRIDRSVDEDYGVDHICFSTPLPVSPGGSAKQNMVWLRQGDQIPAQSLQPLEENKWSLQSERLGPVTMDANELREIAWQRSTAAASKDNDWLVGLADGSRLRMDVSGPQWTHPWLKPPLDPGSSVFLQPVNLPLRYPPAADFETNLPVLVFPTCRILAKDLTWIAGGVQWDPDSTKLLQPVDEENPLGVPGEDPTPTNHSVDFSETSQENLPSFWMQPPVGSRDALGQLLLVDRQRLTFGPDQRFTGIQFRDESIRMESESGPIDIPLDQIQSIRWPRQ